MIFNGWLVENILHKFKKVLDLEEFLNWKKQIKIYKNHNTKKEKF